MKTTFEKKEIIHEAIKKGILDTKNMNDADVKEITDVLWERGYILEEVRGTSRILVDFDIKYLCSTLAL